MAFDATKKFLWVESNITPPSGHPRGEHSLAAIGLTNGVHYDTVTAGGLPRISFSDYEAIAVASSLGGTLTRAELDALIARKSDIQAFANTCWSAAASATC